MVIVKLYGVRDHCWRVLVASLLSFIGDLLYLHYARVGDRPGNWRHSRARSGRSYEGGAPDSEYVENHHPFAVIPVLVDEDGTQIYESRAICRYLVAKYGKGSALLPGPSDVKAYGLFEQAASIEHSAFDPYAALLVYERIVAPMRQEKSNEELIKKCIDMLTAKMDAYERILSNQKYLAGDSFTLADLFHLPYGQITSVMEPQILNSKPHVKTWWDDISSRDSWKATLKFSGH
ncbi:glutathione S-transferase [Rhizoctonia solani]|nr:glutathione S-transferase [Rhizoctonia solani]